MCHFYVIYVIIYHIEKSNALKESSSIFSYKEVFILKFSMYNGNIFC